MSKEFTTNLPDGTSVHWRPLKWGEYRKLINVFDINEGPAIWHLYDAVVGLCLIDFQCPIADDYDNLPAGVIESVGDMILTDTGFVSTRDLVQKNIDAARSRLSYDYYHTGVAYICAAFHFKTSEVDELTSDEFMDYLAMAEIALSAKIDMPDENATPAVKYTEIPDPKTGQTLRVPRANQRGKQSRVE